jgi:hypothetical protein
VHLLSLLSGEGVDAGRMARQYASTIPRNIVGWVCVYHFTLVVQRPVLRVMLCICVSLDAELDCNVELKSSIVADDLVSKKYGNRR